MVISSRSAYTIKVRVVNLCVFTTDDHNYVCAGVFTTDDHFRIAMHYIIIITMQITVALLIFF